MMSPYSQKQITLFYLTYFDKHQLKNFEPLLFKQYLIENSKKKALCMLMFINTYQIFFILSKLHI